MIEHLVVTAVEQLASSSSEDSTDLGLLFLLAGPVFWAAVYFRYRNLNKRHDHETATEASVHNMTESDTFVKSVKGLTQPQMAGANHRDVRGARNKIWG